MSPTPPYYILDPRRLLPASTAPSWLGRIVTDFRDPRADYTPSSPERFTAGLIDQLTADNVAAQISRTDSTTITGALTDIISVSTGSSHAGGMSFQTGKMNIIRLSNYRNLFRTMREDPEVRDHLAKALRPGGPSAYMIVGVLVWSDASVEMETERSKERGFEVQVPVLAIGSAVAGVPIPVQIGDPAVGRSVAESGKVGLSMEVKGRYIFAIEYKAIRRRAYAVWSGAKADWDGRGPRGKGDTHFGVGEEDGNVEEEGDKEKGGQEEGGFDMDDDDCVWYDTVGGLEVEEAELEGMILAVEKS
ncbi:hypothetical protein OQA88_5508 [Cercophora sp. LCS_1]